MKSTSQRLTDTTGTLPNLIIIGAMKSGTTSLHHYLNLHPDIYMSRQKELTFFATEKNWHKGIYWYKSHFKKTVKINGESSPGYTKYPGWKGVAQRMHSVIPETKIIYLLRDPLERIISQYIHRCADGAENRTFERALAELDENLYIERSQYFLQIEQYIEFFPSSRILLLTSDELLKSPQVTMRKVFEFLDVDADFDFKFKANNLSELVKFGPSIASSTFRFDTKMHASFRKRQLKLPPNNLVIKTLSKLTRSLPPEIRCHTERILYRPFSKRITRPQMNSILRKRLVSYLAEDMSHLKQYANRSFDEWNLK